MADILLSLDCASLYTFAVNWSIRHLIANTAPKRLKLWTSNLAHVSRDSPDMIPYKTGHGQDQDHVTP